MLQTYRKDLVIIAKLTQNVSVKWYLKYYNEWNEDESTT